MGEEAKQEHAKAEQPVEKKEEKSEEPKKEEEALKPPPPVILYVDLHCVGCTKKIERSILKIKGVEEVVTDMAQNQVTLKGIVDPQAVCNQIMKKTKRRAKLISPLPPPSPEGEPAPPPQVVTSQVSGSTTVELNVNMHCEACAEQLKKKILKMRGVQTVVTDLSTEKVTVTGTMDPNKLVDYVYRRTKKQARIVPPPEPEPEKKEEKKEAEKPGEEAKPTGDPIKEENVGDDKKTGEDKDKPPESNSNNDDSNDKGENVKGEEEKGGGGESKEEGEETMNQLIFVDEESVKRLLYNHSQSQPMYVVERIPPPQLFSDENPHACCIT